MTDIDDEGSEDGVADEFGDIFEAAPPATRSPMEIAITEALHVPAREQWERDAAPAEATAAARKDTTAWLERILRPAYRDAAAIDRLVGCWSVINGNDALFGSWTAGGRPLQVVVTRERVHVLTRLPTPKADASDGEKIASAAALGRELFGLGPESEGLASAARRLGAYAYAAPEPPAPKGWRTLYLIVTDGVGVKFSFVKLTGDPAEIKGHGPLAAPRPWFGGRPPVVS